jgi:hypothetical protein
MVRMFVGLVSTLTLAGCCYFAPCHPGTHLVGFVRSPEGRAIETATLTLHGNSRPVGEGGCFAFRATSALPLNLRATAPGYRPFEVPAKYGAYEVTILLEPADSQKQGKATWRKITEEQQERQRQGCQ